VLIKARSSVSEPGLEVGVVYRWRAVDQLQAPADPLDHRPPRDVRPVQVEDQVSQARPLQPREDDLQRGPLLGNEENPATRRDQRGDKVGDGLALPGAGRPLHHNVLAPLGCGDNPLLTRIRVQDEELPTRWDLVQFPRVEVAASFVSVQGSA
jgi:hypothetical protein